MLSALAALWVTKRSPLAPFSIIIGLIWVVDPFHWTSASCRVLIGRWYHADCTSPSTWWFLIGRGSWSGRCTYGYCPEVDVDWVTVCWVCVSYWVDCRIECSHLGSFRVYLELFERGPHRVYLSVWWIFGNIGVIWVWVGWVYVGIWCVSGYIGVMYKWVIAGVCIRVSDEFLDHVYMGHIGYMWVFDKLLRILG